MLTSSPVVIVPNIAVGGSMLKFDNFMDLFPDKTMLPLLNFESKVMAIGFFVPAMVK
jgi:hypothetical protein